MLKKCLISILLILVSFIFLYSSFKNILISLGISVFEGVILFIFVTFIDKKQRIFFDKFQNGKIFSDYFFIDYYLGKSEEESLLLACKKINLKIDNNGNNKPSKDNVMLDINENINDTTFNYFLELISLGTYKNDFLFYRNLISEKYNKILNKFSDNIKNKNKSLFQHSIIWLTIFLLIILSVNFINGSLNVIENKPILIVVPILLVLLFLFDIIAIIYSNYLKFYSIGVIVHGN